MFESSLFGKSLNLSQRILGSDVLRKDAIANNIANVDTPHYKRQMVTFESELNRALESEKNPGTPTNLTDSRHIPFDDNKDVNAVQARVQVEFDTNYRNDKNNVDIEKEMADEVKNTLHYQALTSSVGGAIRRLRSVITPGN
jgi:flagellar basal-body rod protein FlgB